MSTSRSEYLKQHRIELKKNGKCRDCWGKHGPLVPGNIVVMSRRANRLKNNASLNEMIALGKWAAFVSGMRA